MNKKYTLSLLTLSLFVPGGLNAAEPEKIVDNTKTTGIELSI